MNPSVPSTLGGRYDVRETLGSGAAGVVLRCVDRELGREVAVKLLRGEGALADRDRLLAEARALARLEHQHIVPIFEVAEDDAGIFLVLEHMPGGSLADLVRRGRLRDGDVLRHARAVLEALAYSHEAGVLHRDLKAGNVLLDRHGDARLGDFGLAKYSDSGVRSASGLILGTPEFMAPEVLTLEPQSEGSDLWAWGCFVYEIADGSPPYRGKPHEILGQAKREELPRGRAPALLGDLLADCLAVDVGRRPSAREALARLGEREGTGSATRTRLAAAVPGEAETEAPRPAGRRFPWGMSAGVGALVLAGVLAARSAVVEPRLAPPARGGSDVSFPDEDWVRRLGAATPALALGRIHETLEDALGRNYNNGLFHARNDQGWPHRAEVGRLLDAGVPDLPLRLELSEARRGLHAFLRDERVAPARRWAVHEALAPYAAADSYFACIDGGRPYGVLELLHLLTPWRARPADPSWDAVPLAGAEEPRERGRFRVAAWPPGTAPRARILVVDPERPSYRESMRGYHQVSTFEAFDLAAQARAQAFDPFSHVRLLGLLRLPEGKPLPERVTLVALVGNLFPPSYPVFRVNAHAVPVHLPELAGVRAEWENPWGPEHAIEVRVPGWLFRPGLNEVGLEVRSPPGIPHVEPLGVTAVGVDLGP